MTSDNSVKNHRQAKFEVIQSLAVQPKGKLSASQ